MNPFRTKYSHKNQAQKFKTIVSDGETEREDFIYEKGYPLGYVASSNGQKVVMLNNHVDLVILYHDNPRYEGNRIVGFEVQPRSIAHDPTNFNSGTLLHEIYYITHFYL